VASIFVAFSYVLHTVTGIDTTIAVFICATITIIYTFTGGMWAVTLTDFLQALVIIVGLCILFPLVIHDIGGFGSLKMQAPQGHFSLLPKGNFLDWMWFIQALLIIPMTAALYWKKANGPGAVSSIVTGMICWITLETVQSTYPAELIAAGIGLITLILVTLATQNNAPPLPPTDIDGNVLDYSHRLGILSFPSSLKRRSEE
jgi:Na+/proline symporter